MFLKKLQSLWRRPEVVVPPNSTNAWRFWMASESLPTLVAGLELDVFQLLKSSPLTESEIRPKLGLSPRACKVLLWHLESLELLKGDSQTNQFSLSAVARDHLLKSSKNKSWRNRIRQMIENPITPDGYVNDAGRDRVMKHRFHETLNQKDMPLRNISRDRLVLPAVIASFQLDLVTLLGERRVDLKTAAETTELSPRYISEMVGFLALFGMANQHQDKWGLSEAGKTYLLTGDSHPYNWEGLFNLMSESPASPRSLIEAIEKEKASAVQENADAMMEHVMSPALAQVFAKHMNSQGAAAAVAIAQHPAFAASSKILDVAGGGGTYSIELSKQNPRFRISVLELSPMINITKQWIKLHRVGARVNAVEGNMFLAADWPKEKFDTVFFSHVVHDWNTDKIKMLFRNAFSALSPGGRLILHEVLIGRGEIRRAIGTAFSVTLYKWTEGRQYKAVEVMDMLRSVGFKVSAEDISSAHGPSSLIVATKPTFSINL